MSHNSSTRPVDFFYLGPPKSASTWVYECLKEHPQVQVSKSGETYFFDKYFDRGFEWYENTEFPTRDQRILADCSPTYIYEQLALERILEHNPKAKFSVGIRNPIERAFSQYWHVKKKKQVNIGFEESLSDYCAFRLWVEPSMVACGLEYLKKRVAPEQIHIFYFDRLKKDAPAQLHELCEFLDITPDFTPSLLNKKINEAGAKWSLPHLAFDKLGRMVFGEGSSSQIHAMLSGRAEYINGISDTQYAELYAFFEPEIHKLEMLTGESFSDWKQNPWSKAAQEKVAA